MPGSPRVFLEDGIYHVDNRATRGERVFGEEQEAMVLLDTMGDIRDRDGLLGWATAEPQVVSYARDHMGSQRAEAWGLDWSTATDPWPYVVLFTGHERDWMGTEDDARKGLDFMHARYYSFNLGRFLSVDPVGGEVGSSQSWNRYAYVRGNPVNAVDPDGENTTVTCDDSKKQCTAEVDVQIVRDPNDKDQVKTADDFQKAAESYWNGRTEKGRNGETIKFHINVKQVDPSSEDPKEDVLTVVSGKGITDVGQTLNWGNPAASPDRGVIYTQDTTGNPAGMKGIAPHEVGRLMGLHDLYVKGQAVPYNPSSTGDIMEYAQPQNGARSAWMVLRPNGDNVIIHLPITPMPAVP